ncbi:MAG TPA: AlpA family phage regulatory protein [Bradyrhizobium sp.]|jgi:prophage regulatory protein
MRIGRLPEVKKLTKLSKSTIRRREKEGRFPRRIQLSDNAVGWDLDEIDALLKALAAERDGVEAA